MQTNQILDGFADKTALAKEFEVSERTIERWVRLRIIGPGKKIGRRRFWHIETERKKLMVEAA